MTIAVGDKFTGAIKLFTADGNFFIADVTMSVTGAGMDAKAGATAAEAKAAEAHAAGGHAAAGAHAAKK